MTWQTLDGQKPFAAEGLRRLRDELAARKEEITEKPEAVIATDTWIDGKGRVKFRAAKPGNGLYVGPVLRAYLDKMKVEMAEAECLEGE